MDPTLDIERYWWNEQYQPLGVAYSMHIIKKTPISREDLIRGLVQIRDPDSLMLLVRKSLPDG